MFHVKRSEVRPLWCSLPVGGGAGAGGGQASEAAAGANTPSQGLKPGTCWRNVGQPVRASHAGTDGRPRQQRDAAAGPPPPDSVVGRTHIQRVGLQVHFQTESGATTVLIALILNVSEMLNWCRLRIGLLWFHSTSDRNLQSNVGVFNTAEMMEGKEVDVSEVYFITNP